MSRVLRTATVAVALIVGIAGRATASEIVLNGGFESILANWLVTANGPGGCDTDWNVSTVGSATGCLGVPNPAQGTRAAYNSLDGNGPQIFRLEQSITLPNVATAQLSFSETASWSFNQLPRSFTVDILDAGQNLLANLYTESFLAGSGSYGWRTIAQDVSAALSALSGQTVFLAFTMHIPQNFTGPAGFGLDAVSLEVTEVPEPATLLCVGSGLAYLARRRRKLAAAA